MTSRYRIYYLSLALVFLTGLSFLHGQEDSTILTTPEGWRTELISFPISFAPEIAYTGIEDIRFAPGWADKESEDFWSYAFVWYINEEPQLSPQYLSSALETYFVGIMSMIAGVERTSSDPFVQSIAAVIEVPNATASYQGRVNIYDAFFLKGRTSLNVDIQYVYCKSKEKHIVLFHFSPQPRSHPVWDTLKKVDVVIDCE